MLFSGFLGKADFFFFFLGGGLCSLGIQIASKKVV